MRDIVTRLDELLFLDHDHSFRVEEERDENAKCTNMFDEKAYSIYNRGFIGMGFVCFFLLCFLDLLLYDSLSAFAGHWVMGVLFQGYACLVMPRASTLHTKVNKWRAKYIWKGWMVENERTSAMQTGPSYGEPADGGGVGTVLFIAWIFWCVFCFNGAGTQRPDWPWLDWLG